MIDITNKKMLYLFSDLKLSVKLKRIDMSNINAKTALECAAQYEKQIHLIMGRH